LLAASACALFWLRRIHQLMAVFPSAPSKPGSIIRLGLASTRSCSVSFWRQSKNSDRNGGTDSPTTRYGFGYLVWGLIVFALYLGETDYLTVTACIWQFPLIAFGMATLLICAVSPRLFFRRMAIPGAAFIASIAYSAYLIQKLAIHFAARLCESYNIVLTSAPALLGVEIAVYAAAVILFFTVERPFLQLRKRFAPRK
jgi:peptidoglycan/LPS O-acetylase OafA/YrhL